MRTRFIGLAVTACWVLIAALAPAGASAGIFTNGCFWSPAVTVTSADYSYPDSHISYWYSGFNLPPGAQVIFHGKYPHARYFALDSYYSTPTLAGVVDGAIHDSQIAPDSGAPNPFLAGAPRYSFFRNWTVTVNGLQPPGAGSPQSPNTLYAGTLPAGQTQPVKLFYRVEVPDRFFDNTGGAGLPAATVVLADGKQLTGLAACNAVGVNTSLTSLGGTSLPLSQYLSLTHLPAVPSIGAAGSTPQAPAVDPVQWYRAVNSCQEDDPFYQAAGYPLNTPAVGSPVCSNTFAVTNYQNQDNGYLSAYIDRSFGPDSGGHNILVLRGEMPTTAATYDNTRVFTGETQLRYWSLCTEESMYATVTTTSNGCVYDQQVSLDANRDYTIVVSEPADRPGNATSRCGVTWLQWGKGDGAPAPYNRPTADQLLMRNQLPDPSFTQAIQNVPAPGLPADVSATMGPYVPTAQYESPAQFAAAGCH